MDVEATFQVAKGRTVRQSTPRMRSNGPSFGGLKARRYGRVRN